MTNRNWPHLAIFFSYIIIRLSLDHLWRELGGYWSYLFEVFFVGIAAAVYWKKIRFKLPGILESSKDVILALFGGYSIYLLLASSGIGIPFDLKATETLFFLLIVGPVLEEFIFRMALWEPLIAITAKPVYVIIFTSLLFAAGHLIAFWAYPMAVRPFILVQTLYVIILGLAAGYRRWKNDSVSSAIVIHFSFNLGFFLGSMS